MSSETRILFLPRSKTMTATRSTRSKKDAKDTQMELDESVQEVKKHREDIELLSQRMAAVEERTYNLSATMKYVQEQHKQDVGKLMEVVTTMKQRLSEVEKHGRRLFKTLRNQLRSERGVDADTQKEKADVQREDREMEFVSHIDKELHDARFRHRDDEVSPPSIDRGYVKQQINTFNVQDVQDVEDVDDLLVRAESMIRGIQRAKSTVGDEESVVSVGMPKFW